MKTKARMAVIVVFIVDVRSEINESDIMLWFPFCTTSLSILKSMSAWYVRVVVLHKIMVYSLKSLPSASFIASRRNVFFATIACVIISPVPPVIVAVVLGVSVSLFLALPSCSTPLTINIGEDKASWVG